MTLLFENRDTIRFQVQEMARAERLHSDEQIQTELDIYNPLIPSPGELSATLFIELTDVKNSENIETGLDVPRLLRQQCSSLCPPKKTEPEYDGAVRGKRQAS